MEHCDLEVVHNEKVIEEVIARVLRKEDEVQRLCKLAR